jgi:biofilm protein TabA
VRKVATATTPDAAFRRAMVYDPADGGGGVYVFLFRSLDDGPCDADYLYEDVAGAALHAAEALGGGAVVWQRVPDPLPGCQDDWLAPVRVARDAAGRPIFGRFERAGE